jgi:ferredoxin
MRILVDFDLCQSHALCTQAAPEVFEVDAQGYLNVKIERPGEGLREKVERAARECPTMAIAIIEE